MQPNVAEDNRPLVEEEARQHLTGPDGQRTTACPETRTQELCRAGIRPDDARRIEEMERELDLPAQQEELDRIRAAALVRSDPSLRRRAIWRVVHETHQEWISAYEGLERLQAFEIVEDSLTFARVKAEAVVLHFVCYEDGVPEVLFSSRKALMGSLPSPAVVKERRSGNYFDAHTDRLPS